MGNADLKEKQEFVTFELIQDSLGLKEPTIFKKYLAEVFNDLANSVNNQNQFFCFQSQILLFFVVFYK